MPNHVDMDFSIKGNREEIDRFLSFAKDERSLLSADKFIPYPDSYKKLDMKYVELEQAVKEGAASQDRLFSFKDGFNSGGYEWCIANWGTKWGIYDASIISETKTSTKINCQSAWSPPIPVIHKMSEMFPLLTFTLKFYEQGCQFCGTYKVKAGTILINETKDYHGQRGG